MGQTHEVSSNITDQQQENEMRRSEKPREGGGEDGEEGYRYRESESLKLLIST